MNRQDLYKVFGQTLSILSRECRQSAAENTSSFSDILEWWIPPEFFLKARDCRLLLVAISFIGMNEVSSGTIYQRIAKIAHRARYEGEWQFVANQLQIAPTPAYQLECFLSDRSLNDFFGNDIHRLKKMIRRITVYNPYLSRRTRVNRPQRKRGYDDKGSLPQTDRLGLEYFKRPNLIPYIEPWQPTKITTLPSEYIERQNKFQAALVEIDTLRGILPRMSPQEADKICNYMINLRSDCSKD